VQDAPPRQDARPEKIIFVENSRHSGQFKPRSTVVPMTPVIHAIKCELFFDRTQIVTYILRGAATSVLFRYPASMLQVSCR